MKVILKNTINGKIKAVVTDVNDFYFVGKEAVEQQKVYRKIINGQMAVVYDSSKTGSEAEAYSGYEFICVAGEDHIVCCNLKTHEEAKAMQEYAFNCLEAEKKSEKETVLHFPDCLKSFKYRKVV